MGRAVGQGASKYRVDVAISLVHVFVPIMLQKPSAAQSQKHEIMQNFWINGWGIGRKDNLIAL